MIRNSLPVLSAALYAIILSCITGSLAQAQWSNDPTVTTEVYSLTQAMPPLICSDGSNGAIVVFGARDPISQLDVVAQRLNASGYVQWTSDGVALSRAPGNQRTIGVCDDGAGGAIASWFDGANLVVQKIDNSGTIQWSSGGVPVCNDLVYSPIWTHGLNTPPVSDGSGGGIVAWSDSRGSDDDIYVQNVNSAGVLHWASGGVLICDAVSNQESPIACIDGAGGAIVAWHDYRSGSGRDIYVQRVSSNGTVLWQSNGVPVCTGKDVSNVNFQICSDGAGGAIILWGDNRTGTGGSLYAQRVDASGAVQWNNDTRVSTRQHMQMQPRLCAVPDGFIVAWKDRLSNDEQHVYAQRINLDGSIPWNPAGMALCTSGGVKNNMNIVGTTSGAIAAWTDLRGTGTVVLDIFAQAITVDGLVGWQAGGIPICTAPEGQDFPFLCSDGNGGAIVAWQDFRKNQPHVYASRTPSLAPPAAPTNLAASATSPASVRLEWIDNSDSEHSFVIERRSRGGAWSVALIAESNATEVVVRGLQPATVHEFRVKAANPAYSSDWSNEATAATPEFPPPANLVAIGTSSDVIDLAWEDHSTSETGFIVDWIAPATDWMSSDTLPANTTIVRMNDLDPATAYSFRVRAVEGTVSSASSNIASAETMQYLDSPTNLEAVVLTANSVRLTWVDRADGETGFEIERRQDGVKWVLAVLAPANATEQIVDGLAADAEHDFRVRAVGNNAASSWSDVVSVSTRVPPSVPQNLTARVVSHQEIDLAWQGGSTNETRFEIERREGIGDWAPNNSRPAGVYTLRDVGLRDSTSYTYRVRAINDLGSSPWSAEASATTLAIPLPAVPIGVMAVTTSARSVRLTWIAQTPQYQSAFEIQESMTGDESDFQPVGGEISATSTSHDRSGLQPNTTYHYRIRAFNRSGVSAWSKTVSTTTMEEDIRLPGPPTNVVALEQGSDVVRLTWNASTPPDPDGFEIERSLSGSPEEFVLVTASLAAEAREYLDSGLAARTTYYYRIRAFNQYGPSSYSVTVSARTKAVLTSELTAALDGKESMLTSMETLLPDGDARLQVLRDFYGEYPRGYDENAARALIAHWRMDVPEDQAAATRSMTRYAMFEELLRDAVHAPQRVPPLPGAKDVAWQVARPVAVLARDMGTLGLAWKQQRTLNPHPHPWLRAVLSDLLDPLHDGTQTILTLMGANVDETFSLLYRQIIRDSGTDGSLTPFVMQSMNDYWQAHFMGRHYLNATQPLITEFADRCTHMDAAGTDIESAAARDSILDRIDAETADFAGGFARYAAICTGLDAAYAISNTPDPNPSVFLRRLMQLRPRLLDGMADAISHVGYPVARYLYLTASEAGTSFLSLPAQLRNGGHRMFDPSVSSTPSPDAASPVRLQGGSADAALGDAIVIDRSALLGLRAYIMAGDTAGVTTAFDGSRVVGRDVVAAINRTLRPLFSVRPADLYDDVASREDYYETIARAQLYKSRRTVLSVALADYVFDPTSQKQADLIVEIDSLLEGLSRILASIDDVRHRTLSMNSRPSLMLDGATLVSAPMSGTNRYRLGLTLRNLGAIEAIAVQAQVHLLTPGAMLDDDDVVDAGSLGTDASHSAELEVVIPDDATTLAVSVTLMASNAGSFVDQVVLAIPQGTTGVESTTETGFHLQQNHPNPFRGNTRIDFTVPRDGRVKLTVHDILGREVRTVLDAHVRAGMHSVDYSAYGLPAGSYVYRLDVHGLRLTRMMQLTW